MRVSGTMAAAAATLASVVSAASTPNYLGFNVGSTKIDGSAKSQSDFETEFSAAQNLVGAPGVFNAARLYTNVQGLTTADPIEAFAAAISTKTYLLLGIWCSGTTSIQNELTALQAGVDKYGQDLADLVIGISIGSEDLYRNSATGVANKAGVGANPDVIVGFINDYRAAFNTSVLKDVPVGHVDTWDVYPNATNKAVVDACDWIGLDEYPYYESGKGNTIENAATLFSTAYNAAKAAVGDKEIWVTETGWPYTGMTWDQAVASVDNAKTYWDEIGCAMLFNKVPTFWYDLEDTNAANNESFAIVDNLGTTARFNLTCPATTASASATLSGTTATATSAFASSTATGTSSSGSGSSNTTSGTTASGTAGSGASSIRTISLGSIVALAGLVFFL